jgi:hypothetical protein
MSPVYPLGHAALYVILLQALNACRLKSFAANPSSVKTKLSKPEIRCRSRKEDNASRTKLRFPSNCRAIPIPDMPGFWNTRSKHALASVSC